MYDQFYPNLLHISNVFKQGMFREQMDLTYGLGTELCVIFPNINTITAYFGSGNVAYLLGLTQAIKVLLSGVFFYKYIRLFEKKEITAFIAACGYAFCGHMMIRQFWVIYATETLIFALWLWTYR